MPVAGNPWCFEVSAAPAALSVSLEGWSRDHRSGFVGSPGKGVVWWLLITPAGFKARYERWRFFVEIRGRITEVGRGRSEIEISVRLEPLLWIPLAATAALFASSAFRSPTPFTVLAGLAPLAVVGAVGGAAWIGAHTFVNAKLIPALRGLAARGETP